MMKNFKGTFYLVQPAEYLGTNIFKMGLTRATEPPYKRLKDYKEGTIVYLTLLINAVNIFERLMRYDFERKFKLYKGKEYFEGDYKDMKDEIMKYYNKINEYQISLKNENKKIIEEYNIEKSKKKYTCEIPNHPLINYMIEEMIKIIDP